MNFEEFEKMLTSDFTIMKEHHGLEGDVLTKALD